jgi:hypothetical protein
LRNCKIPEIGIVPNMSHAWWPRHGCPAHHHTVYRINSPPPFQANQPSEPDQVLVRPPYACCHTSTQRNHDCYWHIIRFQWYCYWIILICRNYRRRGCIPRWGEYKSGIADELEGNLKISSIDPSQAACALSRRQHTVVQIYELNSKM